MVAVRQHLGRKSLQRRVGKTNRRHRAVRGKIGNGINQI
jgi:hypothetical protein